MNTAEEELARPDTVTTTLASSAEASLWRQTTPVADVHAAVLQATSAACIVAVGSTVRKLSPLTVMLSEVEKGRLER